MARTARPLEESEPWSLSDGVSALLGLIARNPTLVGGLTAFLVALSFVSANALWYQPHAHSGAFFATRDFLRPGVTALPEETTFVIERPEQPRQIKGDPAVRNVQETLKQLNFYGGEVDGLLGPNTRLAIEAYQQKMGLAVTGTVDETLLDQLGSGPVKPTVLPSPAPRDAVVEKIAASPAPAPARDEMVAAIQSGLKEFGNDAMEVDGLIGAQTEAALREFQSLFGLPATGKPDRAVYAKMKEIGLVE